MSAEVLMPIIKKALPALAVEVFIIFHWFMMILWMMRHVADRNNGS
jgi:hypothetical protein